MSEISYLKDETEAHLILKSIESNLNSMLNMSDSYLPNFIACILEIAYKHAKLFQLDSSSISTACMNSFQQSLGIVLIEEYLIINEVKAAEEEHVPPSIKRIKFSDEMQQISKAIKLFYFLVCFIQV